MKMKTLYVDGKPVGKIEATGDIEKDIETASKFIVEKELVKEVTVFQAMIRQALSFAQTAIHVYEKDLDKTPINPLGVVPFVVNSAFSIEVYLKAIHKINNNPIKGHKLKILYDNLSEEMRLKIIETAKKHSNEYGISNHHDIAIYIEELDTAFVDWRYMYENEIRYAVKILPTIYVMKVMHEISLEIGET